MVVLDSIDILLLPFYLAIIYFIAFRIRSRNIDDPVYQRYFIRGLNYKMAGSLAFALIYMLYYGTGDSISFFITIRPLYKLAFTSPDIYFSFLTNLYSPYPWECLAEVDRGGSMYLLKGTASLTTIRIGSIINLFCFNSYIVCGIMFAFLSYLFTWKTFRLLVSIYPRLDKEFAVGFLMVPSVIFWGSNIGKDAIMFSAIMYTFYCFYEMVIRKRHIVYNIFALILACYIISLIRGFILYTIAPSLFVMAAIYYKNVFRSPLVRFVALPLFLAVGMAASAFFIRSIGSSMESYSLESLQSKAEGFQSWHTTQGGSTYSLGEDVDFTPIGILRKAPMAMIITLFGPFVWQIRNFVMLMSGLESLALLYFFIRVFLNMHAYRAIGILFRDHIIMFCIPFILIIAIGVGLTSYNYGALVRYKIPILPFFVVLIAVTRYRIKSR